MRAFHILAVPLLFVAAPASATGGFDCEATDGSGIAIGGAIGRTPGWPVVTVRLKLGERMLSTGDDDPEIAIGRSWVDEQEIRVDLVDSNAERFEAELRVRTGEDGGAVGTLVRDGVSHPVRCELE